MKLNQGQLDFIQSTDKNIKLIAPAGCGKTFSILERCKYILKSNAKEKILIFTFTGVARDEILSRILESAELKDYSSNIRVETLNQFGYRNLKLYRHKLKTTKQHKKELVENVLQNIFFTVPHYKSLFTSNKSNQFFIDIIDIFDALKSVGFQYKSKTIRELLDNFNNHLQWVKANNLGRYFEKSIEEKLRNNQLIDDKHPIETFIKVWAKSCAELEAKSYITFVDQKYLYLNQLKEEYKDKVFLKPNQYQHIFVDEFQDINPVDLFLIKELQRVNEASLTIVGDDDQAIYEWRGSTPTFILNPNEYFDNKFSLFKLDTNYRSPQNIVEHSIHLISNNENRIDKVIKADLKNKAEIQVKHFDTQNDYLAFLLDFARKINKENKPKSLAIISRKKSQLIPIQILLTSEEINFFAKEDLNVILSKAFDQLKEVLQILAYKDVRSRPEYCIEDFLKLCNLVKSYPLSKKDKGNIRNHLLKSSPETLQECITQFYYYKGKIKNRWNKDGEMTLRFMEAIQPLLTSTSVSKSIELIGEKFEGMQKHYPKSDEDIFYKDPPFSFLIDYAKRYDNNYNGFIKHIKDATIKMQAQADEDEPDPELKLPIHLMTAMRAKGKEYDNVVLLDVIDGIWPSKLSETAAEFEQERRVFYVAMTRAKKTLTLITTNSLLGTIAFPSPYIKEMKLP